MQGLAASNFTIYLIFLISILLVALDALQLYNIFLSWKIGMQINEPVFSDCIKFNLLGKTAFAIFSFLASFCLTLICFLFINNPDYFVEKIFRAYIKLTYNIFGPIMLCFSIIGLYYFNELCYVCYNKKDLSAKILSVSTCFSLLSSFIISLAITIVSEFYLALYFIVDSITNKPGGSRWVKKVFYFFALKN